MISINATLIAQMLNFLILMYILNRLLFKPILENMKKRNERAEELHDEAVSLIEQGADKLEAYNLEIEQAKSRAHANREEIKQHAMLREGEIIASSKEEEEKILLRIRDEIAEDIHAARKDLEKQARELSVYVTGIVLGRELK